MGGFCACIVIARPSGGKTPPESRLVLAPRCALGAQRLAAQTVWRCVSGWGHSPPDRCCVVLPSSSRPMWRCVAGWGYSPPDRCCVVLLGGDIRRPANLALLCRGTVFIAFIVFPVSPASAGNGSGVFSLCVPPPPSAYPAYKAYKAYSPARAGNAGSVFPPDFQPFRACFPAGLTVSRGRCRSRCSTPDLHRQAGHSP